MSSSSSSQQPTDPSISNVFSVRIVSLDYYMAPPIPDLDICYSTFQGANVREVPVVRIYGSTLAGQKTCLHVHRALPYLYIPCSETGIQFLEKGDVYLRTVFHAVEKALRGKGSLGLKKQRVHGCSFVRAKRLYGYHSSEELFVKIHLYHPSDIARASALLLGNAILDRNIQPYESHIPFLLQFLIDYNLYGMGHIHTSRVKFRHPLPDNVTPRSASDGKQYMKTGECANSSVRFQADSSCETLGSSIVWLSSTIPRDWTWPISSPEDDGFETRSAYLVKRQSICELEGDSCVDDILNQISKIYTSLSQSRPDMKMVQSLVPIWEEEYERTGIQEMVNLFIDNKPPPKSVLRSFLHDLEYETVLARLHAEAEAYFSLDVSSSDTEGKSSKIAKLSSTVSCPVLHTGGLISSEGLPSERNDIETILHGTESFDHLASVRKGALLTDMAEGTHPMVTDIEGARLLSWLASSQAVDDINSDDELGQEVILSPLFPTKSYEKVLEKAHLDYESASQKECQDILDTVEESKSQASKDETASFPENRYSDIVIPQVDGLYDDQDETSLGKACDGNTNCEAESSALCQEGKSTYKKLGKQNKRNKSVWGSLPFSTKQNELEGSISSSVNSEETGVNEARHDTDSSLLLGNRVDGNHDKNNLYIEVSSLEVAEDPGRNSLRDLMRKKRCVHTDIAEYERDMTEEVGQIQDAEMSPSRGRVAHNIQIGDSHGTMRGICLGRQPSTSYIAMACSMTEKIGMLNCDLDIKKSTDTGLNHNLLAGSCSDNPPEFSGMQGSNNNGNNGQNIEVVTTGLHDVDLINKQGNVELLTDELMKTSSVDFDFHGTSNMDIKRTENPQESFEMVLCWKPPTLEQIIKDSEDVSYVGCHIVEGVHNSKRSLRDSFLSNDNERQDDQCVPPFFLKNTKVERGLSHKPFNNEEAPYFHQEVMGGIPVHFQNDGSLLYLLTYAASPPSFDSVSHWVSEQKHQGFEYFLTKKCLENVIKADGGIPCVDKSGHTPNSHVPVLENIGNASHQFEDTCDLKAMLDYLNEEKNTRTMERNSVYDADNMTTETQTTFFDSEGMEPISNWHGTSQISGPDRRSKLTPLSQIGFRDPASMGGGQQLTLLSIEVQAETRGDLRPDPQFDAVNVVTLVIQEDSNDKTDVYVLLRSSSMEQSGRNVDGISDSKFVISSDEKNLFQSLTKIICSIDPDILMGWETQGGSLGFLTERASQIGIHFLKNISRTPVFDEVKISVKIKEEVIGNSALKNPTSDKVIYENSFIEDEWGRTHGSGFHVGGRIVLNLWRLMRAEVKLNMYTVEAVAEEALRQKIPFIPCKVLNNWFFGGCHRALFRCIEYNIGRAKLNLTIVNQLDLINRTSELARVFGIDFFSVLSRGSQFRVESMLLRLAHTQNYLAISPGNQQVSSQPAMECLPLIMEPLSGFYADPVIVLDFQSLYPSMIIAYNLCFSTCLGKVVPSKENVLGVTSYSPDRRLFRDISEQILLCPNGVMYVPSKVRQGVLPRLLEEILSTRIMVKQKMKKLEPSKRVLQRVYNARQLALKLIANVTYGYTAAGFSGRMPCAELADSIVQCGRRTLETAISYVNSHSSWKASVVYGDTDSMFVHLKGRSLEEAFKIGNEIASAITAMNPNPVTLKLEKIYHPCFLLTKKRYVGYSYESPDQDTPMFDAKGIETVRRDTCPAVAKILEQSLRIYFEHQDISEVKLYLQRQWTRILRGKFSIQDFIFAKEVRLGTYSANASSLPPAAIVATKKMRDDPRSEPHYAERVPYVVIHGEPGARLVDMVVDPFDLLDIASPYRLNNLYYINKQIIPALQRVFWLIGVDLKQWYSEIHRPARPTLAKCYLYVSNSGSTHDPDSNMQRVSKKHVKRSRIDSYYLSKNCSICGGLVQSSAFVCTECSKKGSIVAATIIGKTSKLEREIQHLSAICSHCGGADWIIESGVKCNSLVCSVFYERRKVQKELQALSAVATEAGFYPRCMAELF